MSHLRSSRLGRARSAVASFGLACLIGCASPNDGSTRRQLTEDELASYPIEVGELSNRPIALNDGRDPGAVLADLDGQLKRWNELLLSADQTDQRMCRRLEEYLKIQSRNHFGLLERELTGGNARNRSIAAATLGFSADPRATGLLVAAMDDPRVEVIDAALLGLGLLADIETPMEPLGRKLELAPEGWTRNNAAYAIKRLAEAGAPTESIHGSVRLALLDSWDSVRAQAAATLLVIGDRDDIIALRDSLYDPATMVALAAAKAIRRIATDDETARGEAARTLFAAWQELKNRNLQTAVRSELAVLSGRNWGEDTERWREWAYGLP
ncbi:hypothetical protein Pla163_26830 [Planctomycetes bacterium Pla163]|uniref:HEAT repeat protein n=1 Tax=Rohdeia mirabilis TaxID=2528008 RepID=A0A518D244_9BACT|nr:hypothetical protein Pla163_26830 [Planctomycetes bacterium Pla163]